MVVADVAKVEEEIRNAALTKGIRTSEFFLDFDKMRTGNVTTTQFFRVLWENFGTRLSTEEEQAMAEKYDLKANGKMNYRHFCEVVNLPFDANQLNIDPRCQKLEPRELLGTSRTLRPLSPESEIYMVKLLRRLQAFYQRRGIFLRTVCGDFDTHRVGVISESQFYRSFIQPTGISEEDVAKLVQKYRDPDRAGLVNYVNLANDLEALGEVMDEEKAPYLPRIRDIGDYLPRKIRADSDLQQLLDRVRVAIYKRRVRSTEFFKDYDKLRSGVVTVNQFMAALVLAIGQEAQLSETDLVKIVQFYKTPDGRVEYREFCDMLENAFTVPDLEKKPTQDVVRPPEGALGRNLPILMECEEARIREIIEVISDQVKQRRIMMYQYFKDFDRSTAYSRVVTPSQFGRILTFLTIMVSPEDFRLLCVKFADPTTGDINYPAFVQTVDKDFLNYTQDTVKDYQKEPIPPSDCEPNIPAVIDFDSLMQRIRHHVLVTRLRVVEYFQDFDHLRTGTMTKERFLRCLSSLGLSSLGQHNLTKAQFEALAEYYKDPNDDRKVLWSRFERDVESVFTIPNLEKMPTVQVPPSEIFKIPKPGTMDWRFASEEQRNRYDVLMARLSAYVAERRAHLYPYFKSFDKHNKGHLTRIQFRQALSMALLHCNEEEMETLESRFANDDGIDYVAFFAEVEPQEPSKFLYVQRLNEMREINAKRRLPEMKPLRDLDSVLLKVRTKIFKERIRVHDYMSDYDNLNTGRMLKINFRRALCLATLGLQESEMAILEDHYETAGDPAYVDYLRFDDDMEKVFTTKHMEKMPTLDPHQFRIPGQLRVNELLPHHETLLKKCLQRIADKVKVTRIQLFPLFEDYDRVNTACVSRSQFRRVLNELELAGLAPTETEWNCLWEKFSTTVGGREDVNYLSFCDVVYGMAGFEFRRP